MNTQDQKYNGWTNYETWRVNLEIFDGYEPEQAVTAEGLEDMVEDYLSFGVDTSNGPCLALDYARAFVSAVNWYEIAKRINEDHELTETD
jgi:hypothetical protein